MCVCVCLSTDAEEPENSDLQSNQMIPHLSEKEHFGFRLFHHNWLTRRREMGELFAFKIPLIISSSEVALNSLCWFSQRHEIAEGFHPDQWAGSPLN